MNVHDSKMVIAKNDLEQVQIKQPSESKNFLSTFYLEKALKEWKPCLQRQHIVTY